MPARGKSKKRELTEEQIERLHVLETEETAKPIEWFKHDANAHDDPAVALMLIQENGLQLYGMYWLLVERMAARDGHAYRVQNRGDWAVLAHDLTLSPRSDGDLELCQQFIKTLSELGLINPISYKDGYVESLRLSRNCAEVGMGRASKRLAGEITAQQRWGNRESA